MSLTETLLTVALCRRTRREPFEFLAVVLGESGPVGPSVDLAGPAVDEQPNDALRLGREMRGTRRHRVKSAIGGRGGDQALVVEKARETEHAEAHAILLQQGAAGAGESRRPAGRRFHVGIIVA